MAIMLAVMVPVLANTTNAQTRYLHARNGRVVRVYRHRNFYQRHRNVLNIAMAAGGGALVGGLIGGRRGVGYGLLAGGGAGALYTYKLRHRHHRRVVYYNNY